MKKFIGNPNCPIWLIGDSNPKNWQGKLDAPLDPRHTARHNIWTPVLDVMQDITFRAEKIRVDTSALYIQNAIEEPQGKPKPNAIDWHENINNKNEELRDLLLMKKPVIVLCFGAFSYEFCRRTQKLKSRKFNDWTTKTLGIEFRNSVKNFSHDSINIFPLLHISIARGRFIESHSYFCDKSGSNYFDYVGSSLGKLILEQKDRLKIWIN